MNKNTSLAVLTEALMALQEKKCVTEELIRKIKKEIKKLEQQEKLEEEVILSLAKEIKIKKRTNKESEDDKDIEIK